MMHVIVPHASGKLHPLVLPVLRADGINPQPVELADDNGYAALLREIWLIGKPVVIVEQDVLPWPGAIRELAECPCAWGTYSYSYHGGIGIAHMLGCAKLTPELMARTSGLWDDPVHWSQVDQRLFFRARDDGVEPHLHRPAVTHLNSRVLGGEK